MALGFWSLFCADSAMRLSVGGSWRLKSMTSHNGRMLSPRGGYKRFGLEMLRWIVGIKSEIITTLIRHSGLSRSFVKAAFSTGWNRLTVDLKRELEQRLLDANSKTQHTLADLRQEWDARAAQVPRHGQHATYSVWWDVCCFFWGVAAVLQCCSNHSSEWILIALTPLLLVQDSWICRMQQCRNTSPCQSNSWKPAASLAATGATTRWWVAKRIGAQDPWNLGMVADGQRHLLYHCILYQLVFLSIIGHHSNIVHPSQTSQALQDIIVHPSKTSGCWNHDPPFVVGSRS